MRRTRHGVHSEDAPLRDLEWTELIFRMENLFMEHLSNVVEGGEALARTNCRIADTAYEMARRRFLEGMGEGGEEDGASWR